MSLAEQMVMSGAGTKEEAARLAVVKQQFNEGWMSLQDYHWLTGRNVKDDWLPRKFKWKRPTAQRSSPNGQF